MQVLIRHEINNHCLGIDKVFACYNIVYSLISVTSCTIYIMQYTNQEIHKNKINFARTRVKTIFTLFKYICRCIRCLRQVAINTRGYLLKAVKHALFSQEYKYEDLHINRCKLWLYHFKVVYRTSTNISEHNFWKTLTTFTKLLIGSY